MKQLIQKFRLGIETIIHFPYSIPTVSSNTPVGGSQINHQHNEYISFDQFHLDLDDSSDTNTMDCVNQTSSQQDVDEKSVSSVDSQELNKKSEFQCSKKTPLQKREEGTKKLSTLT